MDSINPNLSIPERMAIGRNYAKSLIEKYHPIESVIALGSTVRGDCLPLSNLDMLYLVPRGCDPLPIEKGVCHGVSIDIEAVFTDDLAIDKVFFDGYLFGMIDDCTVLFDRTGFATNLREEVPANDSQERYASRLDRMKAPVIRNLQEYSDALKARDSEELVRSCGFFMWCLADYLLAKHRKPAGGFRALARLKKVNTSAYLDILKLQDSLPKDKEELGSFRSLALWHKDPEKTEWMFENGLKDEALQTVWICLGLSIKEEKLHPTEEGTPSVKDRAEKWLDALDWSADILQKKRMDMESLVREYVE